MYSLFNSGIVKCGYVNISLSATSVRVKGNLQITLLEMNPACCADIRSLYLMCVYYDGSTFNLADYDYRFKRFFPVSVIPQAYQGRLYISANDITISPVRFADEKTKYYFLYKFYLGASIRSVRSRQLELQNVYGVYFSFFISNKRPRCN